MLSIASAANFAAIALYIAATAYLISEYKRQRAPRQRILLGLTLVALTLHGAGMQSTVFVDNGVNSSLFKLPTLFFWVINLIVLISGLRKPLYNLFIFLFPLTTAAILASHFSEGELISATPLLGHIFLAILASGFLTIATLQALLLAFQNRQLKHKHTTGVIRVLPPLQTMERLMFELLWIGEIMLTLLIASGLFIIDDIFAQQQAHTLAFSILAWIVYAILLAGRFRLGWRGNTAIRWTLGGYAILMLAYMGTQLVYQVVLG
ncbi:cytochrome C assembly family protein [Aurantivibrio plasticivorans]